MSSYNHTRLAGLDAMVLHFSSLDQSSSTVLDRIPYVTISRTTKNRRSARQSRIPLGDRTPDLNITPSSTSASLCKHGLSPTSTESRHPPSRPKPYRASTSFHPLPPVPSSSTLQLPSFSNYNFYPSTPLPEPNIQPSAPPSPVLPLSPDINLSFHSPQETLDTDEYNIPAYHHPNSPYVPWAPPIRREILCPPTPASFISSEYSRSYSRSGARAPEPVEPMLEEPSKSSNGWRSLSRALKKNVKHIARCLTNPFKIVASHMSASASSGSRLRERRVLRKRMPRTDKEVQTSTIQSPSTVSLGSCETTTLATWLAARRRMSFERDYDPQSMMSLEEYERMGSWASIPRTASGIDSSCGVPECGIHAIIRDQATSTPWLSRPTSPQSPQSRSFPHLPSWEERSMPGGWA